jgi:hypothetical protein
VKHFYHFGVYSSGHKYVFKPKVRMKTFVTFIVLLCSVSSGLAQQLINRQDRQVGDPTAHIEHNINFSQSSKLGVPFSAQDKTFEITLEQPNIELGLKDYGTIAGHIKNLTLDPVKLIFKRVQSRETNFSKGWTTSVCFGDLCYPATVDSLTPEQAYTLPAGGEAELKLNITTPPDHDDSILVHVLVVAVGSLDDDTVGLWMSAVAKGKGSVDYNNGIKRSRIHAIFPSPLVSGSFINVNVKSVGDLAYKYSIYEPFGREVAYGSSQRKLILGDNMLGIGSLEGLGSGSYLLKVNFSDGSNDAYPFTVIR